jgi:predicted phosphodiesterase
MKIAVISDLHLGVGDASDRFGHDPDKFLRFLGFLEDNFEKVVLLGDIWDPHTAPTRTSAREGLRLCRESHPVLARRFERKPFVYVHGNHDLATGALENSPEHLVLEDHGLRLLFTHGHQHDSLIRYAPFVSDFCVWLGGWLLRLKLGHVFSFFDRLDAMRSGVSKQPEDCTFQRWAVGRALAERADLVVTGHTHLPLHTNHGNVTFLNSGSCTGGRFNFAALDTARSDFSVQCAWA